MGNKKDNLNDIGWPEFLANLLIGLVVGLVITIFVKLPIYIVKNIFLVTISTICGILTAMYLFPTLNTDLPNWVGFIGGFLIALIVTNSLKK